MAISAPLPTIAPPIGATGPVQDNKVVIKAAAPMPTPAPTIVAVPACQSPSLL